MADFPTFNNREDAKKFGIQLEDTGIRSPMEGGYVISRPRTTRRPRRTWMTGFTDLSDAQYEQFLTFYYQYGTYKAFTYEVRTSNELVNVRFPEPPEFKYTGHGANFRWDIDCKLEEV